MSVLRTRPGQYMAGHSVGIVVLEVGYPIVPGNVANASTFPFPVRYAVVRGSHPLHRLVRNNDESIYDATLAAARELVQDGVKAIVGACGYFGLFQKRLAADLPVPVFSSSLLQVPLLVRALTPGQKLGVMCADTRGVTPKLFDAVGITPDMPCVFVGMEDKPGFFDAISEGSGVMDNDQVCAEVVERAREMVAEHPDIGMILLECSDMPPYAHAVQEATGLPVFDFNSMINWVHYACVRKAYNGFM